MTVQTSYTLKVIAFFAAAIILFGVPYLYPCKCPRSSSCPSLPNNSSQTEATFVGIVTDVTGESLESRLRKKGWLQESHVRIPEADWESFMQNYKDSLLAIWKDYLSDSDLEQIKKARQPAEVPELCFKKRIRLRVTEYLGGVSQDSFEILTGFGGGDCGVPFKIGETFLVYAHRDQENRWATGICSGTRQLGLSGSDQQDLKVLRQLRSGQEFVPRIYGEVFDMATRNDELVPIKGANVTIGLNGRLVKETQTDEQGLFLFEGLEQGRYRVNVNLRGFTMLESDSEREFILSNSGCGRLILFVRSDQAKQRME